MAQSKPAKPHEQTKPLLRQKKKGLTSYIGIFLLILFGFFVVNLFFRLPQFLKAINEPFAKLGGQFANAQRLEPKYRTSLLLLATDKSGEPTQAVVASFDPAGKQINFVTIPREVPIITKLDRPLNLSELVEKDFDRAFLEISLLTGTPLQGYLSFSDSPALSQENILRQKSNLFSLSYIFSIFEQKKWLDNHLKTNLSIAQIFSVGQKFKGTNLEAMHFFDLNQVVSNGSFNNDQLRDLVEKAFFDSNIGSEAASVRIVNSSKVAGLGSSFKLLVSNLGGRVVAIDSETKSRTRVGFVKGKEKLAQALARFLEVEAKQQESAKQDVTINIGSDFADKLGID